MFDLSDSTIVKWFLWAFLDGVSLGVLYDLIRAFKMLCGISYFESKRQKGILKRVFEAVVTFFCDVAFFVAAGVVALLLIYRMGGGLFRAFTFGGMISGFALYYLSLGRLTIRLTDVFVRTLKKALGVVGRILFFPVKKIFLALFCLYRLTIGKIIGKIIRELVRRNSRGATDAQDEKLPLENGGGEEEYVYVGSKGRYRKSGRIDFGRSSGKRAEP